MRCCVVVNRLAEVTAGQTTWLLSAAAAARGHDVALVSVSDLELDEGGRVSAVGRRLAPGADLDALRAAAPVRVELDAMDVVLWRTSPGRDHERVWAHDMGLELAARVAERGVVVLNDPVGLRRAASKLYLAEIPAEHRPRMVATRDLERVRDFVAACPTGAVLKPASGTRGQDVFRLLPGQTENLAQIVDVLARGGVIIAQEYLPDAVHGDLRLVLVDGEPLVVDGVVAGVRRVPGPRDFRSNVHVGASAAPGVVGPGHLAAAASIGPRLARDGLFLVGLDLIGEKIIEVNVFSTGGLLDAGRFAQRDFVAAIVERVERRVAAAGGGAAPPTG